MVTLLMDKIDASLHLRGRNLGFDKVDPSIHLSSAVYPLILKWQDEYKNVYMSFV